MVEPWWALLPYKGNGQSKTRLHGRGPIHGQQMSQDWLHRVALECQKTPEIESVWVVSLGDQFQLPQGVHGQRQSRPGLNQGIQEWLDRHQPSRWLVLLPDLPQLDWQEIRQLLSACPTAGIALAPDRHDQGCNGLAVWGARPQLVFGSNSFQRYLQQGLNSAVVRSPGLAHDVDTLADWESIAWHQV